jgi:hypothetical protein
MSVTKRVPIFCRAVMFPLMLFVSGSVHAQVCPPGKVDSGKLGKRVAQAGRQFDQFHPDDPDSSGPPGDSDTIYRASAIGGKALIPALRGISKPWMAPDTVPGAAQVSLAKLGVEEAKQQLINELEAIEEPPGTTARTWWAPRKLACVGNDWTPFEVTCRGAADAFSVAADAFRPRHLRVSGCCYTVLGNSD